MEIKELKKNKYQLKLSAAMYLGYKNKNKMKFALDETCLFSCDRYQRCHHFPLELFQKLQLVLHCQLI